jgi:predicted MFS family arabinose efflux permease
LANIPYSDIIGKVIPPTRRGAFFGGKQALAGPLAVVSALAAKKVLAEWDYPNNYALLFGLAAVALGIASFGFLVMREPAGEGSVRKPLPWRSYLVQLRGGSQRLRALVVVELLTGFILMVMPFYVVYARQKLDAPAEAVGWFLLAQTIGGVLANLIWARLVDHYGSRIMIFWCAITSTLAPVLAILLAPFGWQAMMVVFFLTGAAFDGRKVGFQSALLELAPSSERPTYFALNEVLILPLAFLSLGAGIFLEYSTYTTLFVLTTVFIGGGALMAWRWKAGDNG